jgi:cystathionine gamma-lyase/homocysteine desulfhydrase
MSHKEHNQIKTKLIHGGMSADSFLGSVNVPIFQVSTFKQSDNALEESEYEYSRAGNPTRFALEELIKELEGGVRGFAFSSGMAAISSVFMLFNKGDHIVVGNDVYGGVYRVLTKIFSRFDIESTFIDLEQVKHAIKPNTKAVYVETPGNPLLQISDIRSMAQICTRNDIKLIIDNTFLTPYWQNPLQLGADIVVHSATKFLGGHSDVLAGLVVVNDTTLAEELFFIQKSIGGVLGPQDSWLLIRGIKTLGVRMEEHERNSRIIASWLQNRKDIVKVYYPGIERHPSHAVQKEQARGFGGIITIDVGDNERANEIMRKTKLFTSAISLGAVESLICIPGIMTHSSVPKERRDALGIKDSLIRLSVGLEDVNELIADLEEALSE